ncbi:glycoside hydrolase family 5 protein [Hypholoma sublateritium FD-334 SS-4]|uniref:cellulase n=1 Tax=Hypholoma sublateritium (strain FD-334 SS-4) TaxID=945553 RepID=A0A0D2NC60_HYPSF|nr:glycoside hydrolase family 5 protein [Hypholoma sublateritium FD-334 SS-4]
MFSIVIGALFGLVAFSTATPASDSGAVQNCKKTLPPPSSAGKLSHTGINIAGFDFGCGTDGTCKAAAAWPPLTQFYGNDGAGQIKHFVKNDRFNTFRLPVGWQFLTNNLKSGVLSSANFAKYDALVQTCLGTGSYCIIDIHNYARFNGMIIGQGGPSDTTFARLWSNIASHYKSQSKLIFGIMNEPHDIPNINIWAKSVQKAVTAIRSAGALDQMILLPGNNWTSAAAFVSGGSASALHKIVNLDGSKDNLVFDVHQYLDSDRSGTHSECVTNNIEEAWRPLTQWLRCNGRRALNSETGGGNTASCATFLCQQIAFQARNSDVILGYVGWAAGNFGTKYVLSEVPTTNGTVWTDTTLVRRCLSPKSGSQRGPIS